MSDSRFDGDWEWLRSLLPKVLIGGHEYWMLPTHEITIRIHSSGHLSVGAAANEHGTTRFIRMHLRDLARDGYAVDDLRSAVLDQIVGSAASGEDLDRWNQSAADGIGDV